MRDARADAALPTVPAGQRGTQAERGDPGSYRSLLTDRNVCPTIKCSVRDNRMSLLPKVLHQLFTPEPEAVFY